MRKKPSRPFSKTAKVLLKDQHVAGEYLKEIRTDGNVEILTAAVKEVGNTLCES